MQQNQTRGRVLAEASRTHGTPAAALREHEAREELRALYLGMVPKGRRVALGTRRWRFDDAVAGTAKRNPIGELFADALAAVAAGGTRAQVRAPFERLLELLDAACGEVTRRLPLTALELAETRAQGDADVAVRAYQIEADDSATKRALADAAIREATEHLEALRALRDALCEDRVRVLRLRPRLTLVR